MKTEQFGDLGNILLFMKYHITFFLFKISEKSLQNKHSSIHQFPSLYLFNFFLFLYIHFLFFSPFFLSFSSSMEENNKHLVDSMISFFPFPLLFLPSKLSHYLFLPFPPPFPSFKTIALSLSLIIFAWPNE